MANSILSKIGAIFGRPPQVNGDNNRPTLIDSRSAGQYAGAVGANGTKYDITEENVMDVPAISSIIDTLSGMVASLPVELYEPQKEETPKVVNDDRVTLLNVKPNPQLTPYNFKRIITRNLLLYGQQVIYQENTDDDPLNKNGFLYPLEEKYVTTDKYTVHGYDYYTDFRYDALSGSYVYEQDEVMNILLDSNDGVFGQGIMTKYPKTISLAMAQRDYEESLLANGALPIGVLSTEGKLSNDVFQRAKSQFASLYGGAANAGKTLMLDGGLTYAQASIDPKNLEMTDSKKNMISDIARMFSAPETLINANANKYNSNEENNLRLLQQCLRPILTAIEEALNSFLLLEDERQAGRFFQFNTDMLFQNTLSEKVASYGALYDKGLMSENETRDKFNLKNLPGHDFVKFNLGAVMYQPDTGHIVVPNTGATVDTSDLTVTAGDGGLGQNGVNPNNQNNPPENQNSDESGDNTDDS